MTRWTWSKCPPCAQCPYLDGKHTVAFCPPFQQWVGRALSGEIFFADSRAQCLQILGEAADIHLRHLRSNPPNPSSDL